MNNSELEVLAITKRVEKFLSEGVISVEDIRHLAKMAYSYGFMEGKLGGIKKEREHRDFIDKNHKGVYHD